MLNNEFLMLSKTWILKYLVQCQELMKQDIYLGMKVVHVDVDYMKVFMIINNAGIMINADVNVKNWLTKEYVTTDLFGIQIIVNVNVINHMMLVNIWTIKIVNVKTN